jgi:haloalkane dehalogenase
MRWCSVLPAISNREARMDYLTTPEDRFAGLPDYPWPAHVLRNAATAGLGLAYLDEGPHDAQHVFLCLHGNPTWSYLYRKMLPVFLASGARVVAPDFLGFGRSDKPLAETDHTFDLHRASLLALIEALDLRHITLVVQDWGGVFGLTLPMAMPERFERLLVMNTGFGIGRVTEGFRAWRAFSNSRPDLDVAGLLLRSEPTLSPAEASAYGAPFPDVRYKAAVRAFPNLVPDGDEAPGAALSRQAMRWFASHWRGQSFMAVGIKDPVMGWDVMQAMRAAIPGCPEPLRVDDGGHFVQEHGQRVARAALDAWGGARSGVALERPAFVQLVEVVLDAGAFALEEVRHRTGELRVGQPVRRPGLHRQQAARHLVFALRAAFEALVALRNAPGQRLVVAGLEMQAGHVLGGTPVAAEGGTAWRVDRDQRRGDAFAGAPRSEHQPVLRHRGGHAGEEVARQVGRRMVGAVG